MPGDLRTSFLRRLKGLQEMLGEIEDLTEAGQLDDEEIQVLSAALDVVDEAFADEEDAGDDDDLGEDDDLDGEEYEDDADGDEEDEDVF